MTWPPIIFLRFKKQEYKMIKTAGKHGELIKIENEYKKMENYLFFGRENRKKSSLYEKWVYFLTVVGSKWALSDKSCHILRDLWLPHGRRISNETLFIFPKNFFLKIFWNSKGFPLQMEKKGSLSKCSIMSSNYLQSQ